MMSDLRKKLREKVINTWKKMKEDETNCGLERVKNLRDKRKFAQSSLTRETDCLKGEDSK